MNYEIETFTEDLKPYNLTRGGNDDLERLFFAYDLSLKQVIRVREMLKVNVSTSFRAHGRIIKIKKLVADCQSAMNKKLLL